MEDHIGPANPLYNNFSPSVDPTPVVKVLDKGYVRLIDSMGTDLNVVNAARASYDKESKEFDGKDARLLQFLVREKHTAPFRHGILSLEIYAPLLVARQWWKHVVGSETEGMGDPYLAWNESSRRYITENEEFYIPNGDQWRTKPANSKQGSGENLAGSAGDRWSVSLENTIIDGAIKYQDAMTAGIAPEQARLFLSAYAMYVRWRWTSSLQGIMHFIELRDESHAQLEIQEYARAVRTLAATKFPVSIGAV